MLIEETSTLIMDSQSVVFTTDMSIFLFHNLLEGFRSDAKPFVLES